MSFDPANKIQDLQYFGEFGGVNPSISDSSTYTFLSAKTMSGVYMHIFTAQIDMDLCFKNDRICSTGHLL